MSSVLWVGDDPSGLLAVRDILARASFEVTRWDRNAILQGLPEPCSFECAVLDGGVQRGDRSPVVARWCIALRARGIPVLILSDGEDDRAAGLRAGADDDLPKPFEPEELRLRLERLIFGRPEASLGGRLDCFAVPALVQYLAGTGHSGCLLIQSERQRGRFVFSGGTLCFAAFGRLTGAEAAIAALEVRDGSFQFLPVEAPPTTSGWQPERIDLNAVMLETAWLAEELASRRSYFPSADLPLRLTVAEPDVPLALRVAQAIRLPRLPLAEVVTTVACSSSASESTVVQTLRVAPNRARLALGRLFEVGVVAAA